MESSYHAFIFVVDNQEYLLCDVSKKIAAALKNCPSDKVDKSDEIFSAHWGDFQINLTANFAAHILMESQEMAQHHQFASPWDKVAKCGWRIELWSNLDSEMDHFNDYIFVLETLEKQLGEVVMVDLSSGELI